MILSSMSLLPFLRSEKIHYNSHDKLRQEAPKWVRCKLGNVSRVVTAHTTWVSDSDQGYLCLKLLANHILAILYISNCAQKKIYAPFGYRTSMHKQTW